ncbi:Thioredoxin 1 [Candidatus Ecksteinia adelgidicola]|nr:Thioredoxin 1 [Candidatus Ecksteinia adelgidicola]
MSNKIICLTDDNFDVNVINAKGLILVDFWAEWCRPCKIIAPIIDDIAKKFFEKITITKLNIEYNPKTPLKYGIRSIPTILLFDNGKVKASQIGTFSKKQLQNFINENISS